jgi:hypothetical protein
MDWEVQDFRPKKPIPSWTEWVWPKDMAMFMLWRLFFWAIVIPFILFGAVLTPVGLLIQILVIDYFTYLQWKNQQ